MRKRRKSDDGVCWLLLLCLSSSHFIYRLLFWARCSERTEPSVCSDMPRSDADGDRPGDHPRKETSDISPSLRSRIIRTISGWEGRPVQSRWAAQQRPSPDDWIFCQVFFVCCAARHLNDSLDSLVLMADGRPVTPDRLTIQTI